MPRENLNEETLKQDILQHLSRDWDEDPPSRSEVQELMHMVWEFEDKFDQLMQVCEMQRVRKRIWLDRFLRLWHEGKDSFNATQVEAMGKIYKKDGRYA